MGPVGAEKGLDPAGMASLHELLLAEMMTRWHRLFGLGLKLRLAATKELFSYHLFMNFFSLHIFLAKICLAGACKHLLQFEPAFQLFKRSQKINEPSHELTTYLSCIVTLFF